MTSPDGTAGTLVDPFGLLPHRAPFLLLDRILVVEPGRLVRGTKAVTGNEWAVVGQCGEGGRHAMPHLLMVEALAQLSAALFTALLEGRGAIGYFMGIDGVRLRGEAVAGDIIDLTITLRQFRRGICRTRGTAHVGDRLLVQADLTTILREVPAPV